MEAFINMTGAVADLGFRRRFVGLWHRFLFVYVAAELSF